MKRGFPLAIQKQAIQKLFRQTLAFQRGQTATRRGVSSAVMLIIFLGAAPLYANTSEEHLPTLLVMGDSLSAAYGIEQEQGWVTLLAERLDGEAHVVNASISGETTSGGAQRFADIIGQQQPGIVLLELGGNDGLRGLPPAQMRTNLATIFRLITVKPTAMHLPVSFIRSRMSTIFRWCPSCWKISRLINS